MRCYRRLLNISYKDHVTNEEVRRKIQAAIGEYDELLTLVKKEWTGMDFASSTRAAENRSRWKGIVANSSVVPRRPSKVMG